MATPASVDFGSVSVGDSADQKLTLANNGSEAVQITTLNVSNSAFSVNGQGTLPVSLAAGKSLSINVHFSPKDSTDTSGQLSVNATSNTTTDLSSMIKLHGSGGKKGSLSNLSCANATMTGPGSDTCTVTLSSAAKGNQGIVGLESSSSAIKVPASVTVPSGATTASFVASVSAVTTSQTVTLTASQGSESKSTSIKLSSESGSSTTANASVSALSCGSISITGQLADSCTVSLSGAAPSAGVTVSLASSSSSVKVPNSITVPATQKTAVFTADVAAVSTAKSVTLTATTGSTSRTVSLNLAAGTAALSVNATSISFGSTSLNTPTSQSLKLSATGSASVTVKAVAITGAGFSVSGGNYPLTLSPGQSVSLDLQFDPKTAGDATGQLTISSDSPSNPTVGVSLSGTGASHKVSLSWDPPTSSAEAIAGYNVYRKNDGTASYSRLNSKPNPATTYSDSSVQSGQTYDYVVKSVDTSGTESKASNMTTVSVP